MRPFPVILAIVVAGALVSARQQTQTQTQTQTQPRTQARQELSGDLKDAAERARKATEVFNELVTAPDQGIPNDLLARAEAVIVIPSLVKGGFVVGAQHGKGLVSARRPIDAALADGQSSQAPTNGDGQSRTQSMAASGWSGPAFVRITGGSIGWQIGVESVDLVLLVMNKKGLDDLLEDRFTLGGNLSIAAGPVGRSGNAATNASTGAEILGYSRAKGLFAGATLEGAAIKNEKDENEALYGSDAHLRTILMGGAKPLMPLPADIQQWQDTLARLAARR